jgi:hypothetical protein
MSRRCAKAFLLAAVGALGLGCGEGALPSANEAPALIVGTSQPLMSGDHDYLFIRATRTWEQAGALCDSLGYGLVTVNDAQEEAFLRRFDRGAVSWLGLNDIQTEGRWVWRDGTSSYTHWAPGQPQGLRDENCVAMGHVGSVPWHDYPCNAQGVYVICESRD